MPRSLAFFLTTHGHNLEWYGYTQSTRERYTGRGNGFAERFETQS
jgi:hypothetical protein